ncbi:hypothetical protein HNR42_001641 [Deinobacterium chartae]|uniref:Lipoprotein n=1 Tax=Deinobacterium chartae TaxID=521158 RepID=A0A841HZC4_9DEIO|nr:hypothetical protein [Deinobacterium chartae]MBB6098216.1 hypothetical protein [Deinobacterium chartae]
MMSLPLHLAPLALMVTSLLVACGAQEPGVPAPAHPVSRVQGQVDRAALPAGDARVLLTAEQTVLSSAALQADGRFDLPLPAAAAMAPYLGPAAQRFAGDPNDCVSGLRVTPPDLRVARFVSLEVQLEGRAVAQVAQLSRSGTAESSVWYVFADRPGRLEGHIRCETADDLRARIRFDVTLEAGWNALRSNLFLGGGLLTSAPGPVPAWKTSLR